MGVIILVITFLVETGFAVWSCLTGERHRGEKLAVRTGGILLLTVLLLTGLLEGVFRYGGFMFILVLQILVGILLLRRKKKTEKPFKTGKQVMAAFGTLALYLTVLLPALLFPQYKELQVTGTHEVETAEYTWVDKNRAETYSNTGENRALTVKLWYPKEEGNYPLAVFSHGSLGIIDSNSSTCEELASNGYVVASIGHTYQAMFVQDTSGNITVISPYFMNQVYEENGTRTPEGEKIIYDNSREFMKIRTADMNFVLDTMIEKAEAGEEEPFDRIEEEKIGLFGHSLGGAAAVAAGRERTDISAVIDLEGTMLGEYVDFQNGTEVFNSEPYPVPLLDVNSAEVDAQARTLPGQGYVNFYVGEHAKEYQYEVIEGAGHLNFTDLPMVSPALAKMLGVGSVDARECIESVNQMILEFFDAHLK